MIDTIEAIRTLMKQISGTMANAGLEAKEVPGSKDHASIDTSDSSLTSVNYEGSAGTARLEFSGSTMKILAAKSDEKEFHELSETLFENQNEDWGQKDLRSAGNEIIDCIATFFGTDPVYEAVDKSKKKGGSSALAGKKKTAAPAKKNAKNPKTTNAHKKGKRADEQFDALDLAYRLEGIFSDLRGKADENIDQYGRFLPEEYIQDNVTEPVIGAIKSKDRQVLKRLFRALNLFYDEGEKDTQSLVAVSVLGVGLAKEDDATVEYAMTWMSDTLRPPVQNIIRYFRKGNTQKKLDKYYHPKAYKPTAKERAQKTALASLNANTK